MELTHVTIVVLASMIFVLSGMVGYLYWQQTRILQHIQSLALAVATHFSPPSEPEQLPEPVAAQEAEHEAEHGTEQEVEAEADAESEAQTAEDNDDRVSVEHVTEEVTATEADVNDVDDLETKTKAELQKLLSDKGIPYGKSDKKSVLIQLLKATS